ncbi:aromatic ring-hydroxylating dioxygenase subunit alpha [Novosphingobium sp. YJ-S2-02]|uniref:Aromatic ring-hydroxylating dioxygenase subunit alpha n=2 Tax=Novosphingobium aureum TaxID=2792964 RepID=A0A931HFF0_9SPHN|nr:aromatic ring-hydroxylating dioxygenase subunit alpha [Novosphingobium aureum]
MNAQGKTSRRLVDRPVRIGAEAYVDPDYAREEAERLWPRVWQVACREEELEKPGDYVTYDIVDDSVIVLRSKEGTLRAFHNVCRHRARRLTQGCGNKARLTCPFHAWSWDLEGQCIGMTRGEAWGEALGREDVPLLPVQVDTWGGWVFVNMDLEAAPLADYMGEAATNLAPFAFETMRYRWRQYLHFPCNWKVAVEAFNEGYHVAGTHPQLTKFSAKPTWSDAWGLHGVFGSAAREGSGGASSGAAGAADMREGLKHSLNQLWEEVNATTTQTMVDVANRLPEELPEGTPAHEVQMHLMKRTIEEDAKRGVLWPAIDPAHFAKVGNVLHIFPNTVIVHGPVFALCYRARPDGTDPNRCIFEVYTLEKFPEGAEPRPDNLYRPEMTEEAWRKVLCQDFSNMEAVQQGLRDRAFPGIYPSPEEEKAIVNFHRVLADYVGRGAPEPID